MERITEDILQQFCSKNSLRPEFRNPFIQGGFICATNTHILITIKSNHIKDLDHNNEPNIIKTVKSLEDKATERDVCHTASLVDKINFIDAKIKEFDITSECPDCCGDEYVTYTYISTDGSRYESEYECPVCEDGYDMYDNRETFINILGFYFKYNYIKSILEVCDKLKVTTFTINYDKKEGTLIFNITNGVKVYLMPIRKV